MAHKESYNAKQFEDKGWKGMHAILNKEMPLKKINRRPIILWWIGSAAAFALILIYFISTTDQSSTENIISKSTSPDTALNKIKIEGQTGPPIISNANIPDSSPTNINTNPTLSASLIKSNSNKSEQIKDHSNNVLNSHASSMNGANFDSDNSIKTNNKPTNTFIHPKEPLETIAGIQNAKPSLIRTLVPIAALSINELYQPNQSTRIPTFDNDYNRGSWNINAFTNRSGLKKYSEIGFGINRKWELHKRWTLALGMNYVHRINLFNPAVGIGDGQEQADLQTPAFGQFPSTLGFDNFYTSANSDLNAGQIESVLSLSYKFVPNWILSGNIMPSYYFFNQSKYLEILNGFGQLNFAGSDFEVNPTRKWNIHLGLGIGYQLSRSMAVQLNYNYLASRNGITDIVSPNFDADEWRLGLHYTMD